MSTRIYIHLFPVFFVFVFGMPAQGQRAVLYASSFYSGCRSLGKVVLHPADTNHKYRYQMVSSGCNYPIRPIQDSPVFDNLPTCTYTFQAFDENNQLSETVRTKVGIQIEPNFYLSCGQEKGLYFVNLKIYNSYNHLTGQYSLDQNNSRILQIVQDRRGTILILSDTASIIQLEYQNDPAIQTIIYVKDGCGDFDSTLYQGDLLQPLKLTLNKNCEGQYIFNNNLAQFGITRATISGGLSFQWYLNDRLVIDSTVMVLNSFNNTDRVLLKVSGMGCLLNVTEYSLIDTGTVPIILKTNSVGGSICIKQNTWLSVNPNQGSGVTVRWNTGETADSIRVMDSGKYTAIGNNSFGCRDTLEWVITTSTLAVTSTTLDNLCFGQAKGKISIESKGPAQPYQYEWEDQSKTNFRELLSPGIYNVTVVDAEACVVVYSYEIKSPPKLNLSVVVSNSTCSIKPNGSAQGLIAGGLSPYVLSWSNGLNSTNINSLSPGRYHVIAKDMNQCLDSISFDINSVIKIYRVLDTICFGSNFQIGNSVYSSTGNYVDTLKSIVGCDSIVETQLIVSEKLQAEITASDPQCFGSKDGEIKIRTLNGYPAYKFYLNNKIVNNSIILGLESGEYKIKIEDRQGCVSESLLNLNQPPMDRLSLGQDTLVEYGDSLHVKLIGEPVQGSINLIQWETDPVQISCTNCVSIFHYQPTGNHKLKAIVTTTRGCTIEASVNITIKKNFKVYTPNIFNPASPYSDNRFFTIFGDKRLLKIKFLRIFNRTGGLVFEVENTSPNQPEVGWDGRFRGQDVEQGIYVYMAELLYADQSKEIIKGDVLLLR